jgi:hypothetical protein
MITGSGRVSLLSGRIRCYWVGLSLTGWIWLRYAPMTHEPLGRGLTGWVARARGGRLGRTEDSAQKLNSNKNFFLFQIYFINYKSIQIQIKFKFQRLLLAQ